MRLTRINSGGRTYYLESVCGDSAKTKIHCLHKDKSIVVNCPLEEMNQRWYNYFVKGQYIQVAFDNLTDDEREFIKTGITAEKWAEIFKDSDE